MHICQSYTHKTGKKEVRSYSSQKRKSWHSSKLLTIIISCLHLFDLIQKLLRITINLFIVKTIKFVQLKSVNMVKIYG